MGSKNDSRETKQVVAGVPVAALADTKEPPVSPPRGVPDIPHPLGELPPEAGQMSQKNRKKRSVRGLRRKAKDSGPLGRLQPGSKKHDAGIARAPLLSLLPD